jgi:NADH-ubiquinone oxidoreductase chain 2
VLALRLFIAIRSNSTIIIWVRLEFNMLRFLPIITSREYSPIENSIKYFLVQRIASIIYITCVLLCLIKYNFILEIFMSMRIIIKLGAAPFHGWFLSLSKSLRLFVLLLISTVQKIIPILIIRSLNMFNTIIVFVCFVTFFVIFYNRMILLNLIKILALSGINNLVWFLVRMASGIQFFFFFFYLLLIIYRHLCNIFFSCKKNF